MKSAFLLCVLVLPVYREGEGRQRVGFLNINVCTGLPALLGRAMEWWLHISVGAIAAGVRLRKSRGGAGKASQAGAVVGSLCHAGCEVGVAKNIKRHRAVRNKSLTM